MTVADTSVWVQFLRGRPSEATRHLRRLLVEREVAVSDPIAMELLSGARTPKELRGIRGVLAALPLLRVENFQTWEDAAAIYRACRRRGHTIKSQLDCLIAAVAIREGVPVLHVDRDFDLIARHTPLQIVRV